LWIIGKVISIDVLTQLVVVKYDKEVLAAVIAKVESEKSASTTVQEQLAVAELASRGSGSDMVIDHAVDVNGTIEGPVDGAEEFKELPADCTRVVHINSEEICAVYTHNPKPKALPPSGLKAAAPNRSNSSTGTSSSSSSSHTQSDYSWGDRNVIGKPVKKGVVGLGNVGNSCYMNAVLQCICHTFQLSDIFLSNRFKEQINVRNPLGYQGAVAQVSVPLTRPPPGGESYPN
jgi:hypothetical protein